LYLNFATTFAKAAIEAALIDIKIDLLGGAKKICTLNVRFKLR